MEPRPSAADELDLHLLFFKLRARWPLFLAGVVLAGCSMAQEGLLDSLKKIHGTDFTIFAGDVRLVTTIIQDGKRVVGTKLAAATADRQRN